MYYVLCIMYYVLCIMYYVLSLVYGVSHIVPYCVYTYAVSHPSTTMLSDYVDYTPYLCRNFVNILLFYTYCHFLLGPHL